MFAARTWCTVSNTLASNVSAVRSNWTWILCTMIGTSGAVIAGETREVLEVCGIVWTVVSRRTFETRGLLCNVVVGPGCTGIGTGRTRRAVVCHWAWTTNQWVICKYGK